LPRTSTTKTRTRWGDRDGRRRDILDAGRRLLERRGYQAFTMRDLARGAGVTAGLVYTYFASKEELFAALYAERLDRFAADIAPLCRDATSAEELFIAVAGEYRAVYQVFGRELNVWAVLLETGASREEVAQPLVQAATATLSTVQAAIERLAPGRRDPLALPLLWATLHGLCDHFTGARHRIHPYGWDELVRFAARTLVRGLTPEED